MPLYQRTTAKFFLKSKENKKRTYKKHREGTSCEDCLLPEWVFCGSTNFELINDKCEFVSAPDTKASLYNRPLVNACAPRTFLGIPMSFLLGCDRLRPECGADLELDHAGLQCAPTPCLNGGIRYPDGVCRQPCLRGEVRDPDGVCRQPEQSLGHQRVGTNPTLV